MAVRAWTEANAASGLVPADVRQVISVLVRMIRESSGAGMEIVALEQGSLKLNAIKRNVAAGLLSLGGVPGADVVVHTQAWEHTRDAIVEYVDRWTGQSNNVTPVVASSCQNLEWSHRIETSGPHAVTIYITAKDFPLRPPQPDLRPAPSPSFTVRPPDAKD